MKKVLFTSAFAAVFLYSNVLQAQVKDLIGTWSLISSDIVKDGSKIETFGPNPMGSLILTGEGHFALIFLRRDLPKVASGNRLVTTPEEDKAIAGGLVSSYGTYSADSKFITLYITGATFANWTGADQKRAYPLTGDTLAYPSPGTTAVPTLVTLKREK